MAVSAYVLPSERPILATPVVRMTKHSKWHAWRISQRRSSCGVSLKGAAHFDLSTAVNPDALCGRCFDVERFR